MPDERTLCLTQTGVLQKIRVAGEGERCTLDFFFHTGQAHGRLKRVCATRSLETYRQDRGMSGEEQRMSKRKRSHPAL